MCEGNRMRYLTVVVLTVGLVLNAGCGSLNRPFSLLRGEHDDTSTYVGEANPLTVDIPVAKPTQEKPVTLGAAVDRTQVSPGESILLVIRCKTAEPWYIYAAEAIEDIGVPTRIELQLPAGVTQQSPWQLPTAKPKQTPLGEVGTYAQDVRFMVPLHVSPQAPKGAYEIKCDFHYQSCSDSTCLSPASQKLVIPISIQPK